MVLRDSLLGVYVAEHSQLLIVVSTHEFFLPVCAVETKEFFGTPFAFPSVHP